MLCTRARHSEAPRASACVFEFKVTNSQAITGPFRQLNPPTTTSRADPRAPSAAALSMTELRHAFAASDPVIRGAANGRTPSRDQPGSFLTSGAAGIHCHTSVASAGNISRTRVRRRIASTSTTWLADSALNSECPACKAPRRCRRSTEQRQRTLIDIPCRLTRCRKVCLLRRAGRLLQRLNIDIYITSLWANRLFRTGRGKVFRRDGAWRVGSRFSTARGPGSITT